MKYKYPRETRHVFRDNPELKTVPEYACLNSKQMCWVMLAGDPESPHVYLLSEEEGERKIRYAAALAVGWGVSRGEMKKDGKDAVLGLNDSLAIALIRYREETCFEMAQSKVSVSKALKWVNEFIDKISNRPEDIQTAEYDLFKLLSDFLKNNVMSKGVTQYKDLGLLLGEGSTKSNTPPPADNESSDKPGESSEGKIESEPEPAGRSFLPNPNG